MTIASPFSSLSQNPSASQRLLSLDFLRGLTMVLLTLESAGLFHYLQPPLINTPFYPLLTEFYHHEWHGLHFWDLVQPTFMFVAGTAMAFSLNKQRQQGKSWSESFRKTLKRSGWLFFWGVLDYAVGKNGLSFKLWDVLTQLSFTTLITFLVIDWSTRAQIVVSFLCLLIPELLYRFTHIPGYDQPFTDQHNFGNYMDMVLMGRVNDGGWVAINCISTTAHTIWGAMAGRLLLSSKPAKDKLKYIIFGGIGLLVLGFGLDWVGITPIIKKIATSTFVLASGGWVLLFLALSYWWVDMLNHKKNLLFVLIFGMNSIFIYLFFEIVGDRWFTEYVFIITNSLFGYIHMNPTIAQLLGCFTVFGLEAGILYFLYRKKIFFKL
jgi:predicted acyltransferase